jgi:hypothetical protein
VRRFTDGHAVLAKASDQLKAAEAGLRKVSTMATVNAVSNIGVG